MTTFAIHNRRRVLLSVFALLVVVLWGTPAHSTTVTPSDAVTSYVVVRALPSTQSAKLGTFAPGDQAEVLESVPSWLKIQLISGTIGYVSKRWVIEVQAPSPSPSPTPTPTAPSPSPTPSPTPTPESPTPSESSTPQPGGFDAGCTLPFDSIKQKHPIIDDSCSRDGTKSGGGPPSSLKLAENHAKNNFCLTGAPIDISYDDLKQLQLQTEQNNVQEADLTDEATRAAKLGNLITVDGHSLGEGTLVRTVLYVIEAHPADTIDQYPNSFGESVNCYRPSAEENDVHIALGEQTHIDECLSVTAEMSPHFRPAKWTPDNINSVGEHPVRVTGHLFYDSSHQPCKPGTPAAPKRVSVWEIHPVYAFEVCTSSTDIDQCKAAPESAWQPLDQFTP